MADLVSLADALAREFPGLAEHPNFKRLRGSLSRSNSLENSPPLIQHPLSRSDRHSNPESAPMDANYDDDPFSGSLDDLTPPNSPSPTSDHLLKRKRGDNSDGEDELEPPEEEEETTGPTTGLQPPPKKKAKKPCKDRNAGGKSTRRLKANAARLRLRGGAGSETPEGDRNPGDLRRAGNEDNSDYEARCVMTSYGQRI